MIFFAILPVTAFFLLWVLFIAQEPSEETGEINWQGVLIRTGLFWSAYLMLGTELLSLMRGLTAIGIIVLWLFALIILGLIHWRFKSFLVGWQKTKALLVNLQLNWFDLAALSLIVITLVILLINGFMSPPNIHDELTYHMSRIMQWAQNRSLAFFPTSITWQLWMPPFSEVSQLHWHLLAGGDVLSALNQWCSLVLTMVAVAAIAKVLGAKSWGQWLSALFVLTLPIVVLQASGAKNDIVLAFFFASLAYYVVKLANQPGELLDWVSTGIAFGLGILTKGNFPFFALPLLVWLLIIMLTKAGWQKTLSFAATGFLVVVMLNAGHWIRNTLTFGGPFNTGDASFTLNARFGLDVVISNLLRNITVQLNRVGFVTEAILKILTKVHAWMGMPLHDPAITQGPRAFFINPTREEVVGNPLHFVVTVLVFVIIFAHFVKSKNRAAFRLPFMLAVTSIAGMVIFSGVFRWQVWGTRYFIPYYILFTPVLGMVVGKGILKSTSWVLGSLLIIMMLNPLLNNYSRSFSWSDLNRNSIWHRSRRGLRFANHEIYEDAIIKLSHLTDVSGCRTYGMVIGPNSPEYLIWGTLTPEAGEYYLEHIAVDNPSAVHQSENFDPCGIIVFEGRHPDIAFEGAYILAESWEIPPYEGYPLTLYLLPDMLPLGQE